MKLTRTDKNFLISRVLTETFKAKFDAWELAFKERIQAEVILKQPFKHWVLKDKEIRPYLYVTSPQSFLPRYGRNLVTSVSRQSDLLQ